MAIPRLTARDDSSDNGHRIAIRIKPVAFLERRPIRAHREVVPGECGDEHDQRRTRKMKVGDEFVYRAELVRRANEDARLSAPGRERPVWLHRALEGPNRRRPDGPDPATGLARHV